MTIFQVQVRLGGWLKEHYIDVRNAPEASPRFTPGSHASAAPDPHRRLTR